MIHSGLKQWEVFGQHVASAMIEAAVARTRELLRAGPRHALGFLCPVAGCRWLSAVMCASSRRLSGSCMCPSSLSSRQPCNRAPPPLFLFSAWSWL
jgi:hypothetical protein